MGDTTRGSRRWSSLAVFRFLFGMTMVAVVVFYRPAELINDWYVHLKGDVHAF